jgi:hypothetical protein
MNKSAALTLLAAKAALGASLALGFATSPAVLANPHDVIASPAFMACEEDQPCWDPCTMGNRQPCPPPPGTGPWADATDDALYFSGVETPHPEARRTPSRCQVGVAHGLGTVAVVLA